MRRAVLLLTFAVLAAAPVRAAEDTRIMMRDQEPQACKMMWQIITAGAIKHSFESLQDPEARAIAEQDDVEIEIPALLQVKPDLWTCDIMPGNLDVVCTARTVEGPAPGQMKQLEKKMKKLVQSCTSTDTVGWRDNVSVDARRGYAYPFNEDIIGFVKTVDYKLQDDTPSGTSALLLSFSIGKLKN